MNKVLIVEDDLIIARIYQGLIAGRALMFRSRRMVN